MSIFKLVNCLTFPRLTQLPELTTALGKLFHPDLGSSLKAIAEVQTAAKADGSCGIGCSVGGPSSTSMSMGHDVAVLSRPKRQQGAGATDQAAFIDQMISHLLSLIPLQIQEAVDQSEAEIAFLLLKRRVEGWSIIVGSWNDCIGEWLQNGRTIFNFGGVATIYNYGFLFFYGLGFGLPLLVGLPEEKLACGVKDFRKVLQEYGMDEPDAVARLVDQFGPETARSVVSEFDTFLRLRLACVLDRFDQTEAAADVEFSLDEVSSAISLRLDLEEDRLKALSTNRVRRGLAVEEGHEEVRKVNQSYV